MDESGNLPVVKGRLFNLEDKLRSKKYNSDFAVEMRGKDVSVSYFQANGFPYPLLIKDKTGLGMRVPSESFTVSDIKRCVGSKRIVDVMDTDTETHQDMSMKEWVRYYENKERTANLNVTNLEFTNTKLETYVEQPEVVRLIDWVHHAWPLYSHDYHSDDQQPAAAVATSGPASSLSYPKMQRFCIMTVAKSYTDFHIDMAGSSVWYHILHGKKTMWLVPPTETNFDLFKKWTTSDSKLFFADSVAACQRINLETGSTILIPAGWIHSIYTAEDSLSFSGNFLHSFSIQDQLRVYQLEGSNTTLVNACSPYFNELHWYVLEGYVHAVLGIGHRIRSEEEMSLEKEEEDAAELKQGLSNEDAEEMDQKKFSDGKKAESVNDPDSPKRTPSSSKSGSKSSTPSRNPQGQDAKSRSKASSMSSLMKSVTVKLENCLLAPEASKGQGSLGGPSTGEGRAPRGWVHLTTFELEGLKAIVEYLEGLPLERQKVPHDIRDPVELIKDLKTMLSNHCKDNPKLSITGQPVLMLPGRKKLKAKLKGARPMSKSSPDGSSFIRRRRVRCKKCEPCTRSECGECPFCKDMKKFGGQGRMKQTCISRQCMAPILPTAAVCVICEKGDAISTSGSSAAGGSGDNRGSETSPLMECGICWKILHPSCLHQKYPDLSNEGILNEDLPNSWECPRCCDLGKQGQLKPRVVKGLGFVLKQHKECHPVMSSSDESDGNSYEQEKIADTSKTPASVTGKKPGPIKRKQPMEKEGLPKNRKKKFLSEVMELEQPLTKKMMMDVSTIKEEKPKTKQSLANGQEAFVGESSTLQPPLTASVVQQQLQDPLHVTPGRNLESQTPSCTGGGRIGDPNTDLRIRDNLTYPTPFPPTIPKVAVNKYVVRPAPIPPPPKNVPLEDGSTHPLDRDLWIRVFRFLSPRDLARCMSVSKTFNRWCYDRRLWYTIDVSWCQIKQMHLIAIVRRQPKRLNLSWTNISHRQLLWMLNRLPHLKHLNLAGNSWPAVSSLCCCAYPFLLGLNLNWVAGVQDACVRDLLSPPIDRRPGVDPTIRHLDRCTDLRLAGSDITNTSLELIISHLTRLKRLDLSYCVGIDDRGIEILADDKSPTQKTLRVLMLASCSQVTPVCLKHLDRLASLEEVDLQACPKISEADLQEFIVSHPLCRVTWQETGVRVIEEIECTDIC